MQVRIVADSLSPQGKRIVTFELEYPRFIHAEVMTHRMFSRNGQSSRAVPTKKSMDQSPVLPIMFGKNKPGMSSDEPLSPSRTAMSRFLWLSSAYVVRASTFLQTKLGLHKQWANRPLEWQQNIKVVLTSTEWDNFFGLRLDSKTVQPEMVELALLMKREMELSVPISLKPGEWHLPYIDTVRSAVTGDLKYEGTFSLEVAKVVSVSCCAQVSYRTLDKSYLKAKRIVERLADRNDPHLSPFEHQATPMMEAQYPEDDDLDFDGYNIPQSPDTWENGITHMDRDFNLWSGNFQGYIQNRQLWSFK